MKVLYEMLLHNDFEENISRNGIIYQIITNSLEVYWTDYRQPNSVDATVKLYVYMRKVSSTLVCCWRYEDAGVQVVVTFASELLENIYLLIVVTSNE